MPHGRGRAPAAARASQQQRAHDETASRLDLPPRGRLGRRRRHRRGAERSPRGPEIPCGVPRPCARGPATQVVALDRGDGLDPARVAPRPPVQLGVGGPAVGQEQAIGLASDRVPERDQPERGEPRDQVAHVQAPSRRPRSRTGAKRRTSWRERDGLALEPSLGDDHVGPALDPPDEVGNGLRVVGEVGVHEDRRVALGPVGQLDRLPKQRLHRRGVAPSVRRGGRP